MPQRFLYYFIPLFLVVYFILSFIPVALRSKAEIFPFFSFKLFSRVPNRFEQYDVVVGYGTPAAHFVVRNNTSLNSIEQKYYLKTINEVGEKYAERDTVDWSHLSALFPPGTPLAFVRRSGNYLPAVRDGQFDTEVVGVFHP